MINYIDAALFAFVVAAHVGALGLLLAVRVELRLSRSEAEEREAARMEREAAAAQAAIARDRALAKQLQPVLRPPTRPMRGFLAHVPASPAPPSAEPGEGPVEGMGDGDEMVAIVVWRRHERGEDAERTLREVAQ